MKPREGLSSDLREMPRGYTAAKAFRATRKIDRQPEVKSWRTISYPAPVTMSRNRATL